MSLNVPPVSGADVLQLEQGIQFFTGTPADAAAQAAAINAAPGNHPSVLSTAITLLNTNLATSQVAMATSAIMEGGTIPIGDAHTPNTVAFIALDFLPGQVAFALTHGFNATVYAAEATGLALANTSQFLAKYSNMEVGAFIQAVGVATGVDTGAIKQWVDNWTLFYSANANSVHVGPTGLTPIQEAYGAAFGDAIGVALITSTSANLHTASNDNPLAVIGLVANALINNAEGGYKVGISLGAQPQHQPLEGEVGGIVGIMADTHVV